MRKKKPLLIGIALVAMVALVVLVIRGRASDPARIQARADELFAKEQYDGARLEYTNLIKQDQNNAYAFQQIGYGYLEQGLTLPGIRFLRESLRLAPENAEAKGKLASAFSELGFPRDARMLALEVLDQVPDNGQAILLLASTSKGDTAEFTAQLVAETSKRLAGLDPNKHAAFHLARAVLSSIEIGGLSETAKASLDRALELEPDSSEVHLARASFAQMSGDKDAQRLSLAKAAELSPPRSVARVRYAAFLADLGETEAATKLLMEQIEKAPDYVPAIVALAGIEARLGKHEEAIAHLDTVIKMDSLNYDAQMAKVNSLLAQEKIEPATELLKRLNADFATGLRVQTFAIKLKLAQVLAQQGDLPGAGLQAEQAIELQPESAEAIVLLAQINLSSGVAGGEEKALAAQRSLEALLEKRPGLLEAELLLTQAYKARGSFDKAADVFKQQIKREPTNAVPHFKLGVTLREQGLVATDAGDRAQLFDDAITSFEAAQRLAPEDQNTTLQLIGLDIFKKDFLSAHSRVQAHLDRENGAEDWGAHYLKGCVFLAEQKAAEAEKSLLRAIELKPDATNAYQVLIQTYKSAGNLPQEIAQTEKLLELQPDDSKLRMDLALALNKNGDVPGAVEVYEKTLEKDPDYVPALNNLAYINAFILGDNEKAIQLADRAHSLAPKDPGVTDTLGWILYQQREYPRALVLLEEAAQGLPGLPEVQYHLGMARAKMGMIEQARAALEQAVASEASYRGKEEAIKRLAQLGVASEGQTIEQLEALLEDSPEDSVARTQLGVLYEDEGQSEKAAEAYEAALKVNPDLVAPHVGLARLYVGPLDDLEKALGFADRARQLAPRNSEADGVRGLVALRQREFDYAYSLLQAAVNDPSSAKNPLFQAALAQAAYANGRIGEARQWMGQLADPASAAGSAAKADAAAFLAMTAPLDPTSDTAALKASAVQRLRDHPDDLAAAMRIASLESSAGQGDDAIKSLEGIIKRSPNFIPAQKELASILAQIPARREDALKFAESVRRALSDDPGNTETRGILSLQDDAANAIVLLESVDLDEALSAVGLFYLGKAYLAENQNEKAQATLRRAIDAGLGEGLAEEANEALKQAQAAETPE